MFNIEFILKELKADDKIRKLVTRHKSWCLVKYLRWLVK